MKVKRVFPDWLIGVLLTLLFLFITLTGVLNFTDAVELKTFDLRAKIAAPDARDPDIELVVITEDDLSGLGRFPWPRDIMAHAIQNLALSGARVIALNILFPEPEKSAGLKTVRTLQQEFDALGLGKEGPVQPFYSKLSQAVQDLDNDAKLRKAMKEAANVVLPVYFDMTSAGRDPKVPEFITKHAYKIVKGVNQEWAVASLIWVSKVSPLLPAFADVAAGIGHNNLFKDDDGSVRDQIHVVGYQKDLYFPSFPMAIVKAFKGLKDEDVNIVLSEGILIKVTPSSMIRVPVIDSTMRTLINWSAGPNGAFHQTPFSKVYKNEIQTSLFKDKIVIIGPTAPGIGDRFVTPISAHLPGVEIVANTVSNILKQSFFSRPRWIVFLELGVLVLFGLFTAFVLPRLKAGMGAMTTLGLFLAYGLIGTILFFSQQIWLKITPPLLLLVVGYILVISKKSLITEKTKEKVEADSVETNKMLGLSFQQQGMLDLDTKPTLGRYEVVGELGRGAMGVVYKGEDPKIHRTVAIKTVRLSDFEEEMVGEMKERFFREAESAGLLIHPNIVTIYDCGEEHDLAYIAMEYLDGEDLEKFTIKGHLLPMRETLSVVARVADALDYAHGKGIVHRDIKPANIMRLKGTGEIKVTDFGIARITTSSKTRTGVVLGTPSYMSPEQVAAKKVDGRSDVFSLGVVLFELLTGEKPFKADDITSLMYQIAKEKHPNPRTINPKVFPVLEKIIDKALEKDETKRYQKAGQMADHLKKVVAKIDEVKAGKASPA